MAATAQFTRGMIVGGGAQVSFQWNPHTVKIVKNAKWNHLSAAGREAPILQYGCGQATAYELDMQLSMDGDFNQVKKGTDDLLKLTKCTSKGTGVDCPPVVTLILGSALKAKCVVEHVDAAWSPLFEPNQLLPEFGKLRVKLTEYKNA